METGVPSLSILDGWWIEGCIEGFTGWAIEDGADDGSAEAHSLYSKLETAVVPLRRIDRAVHVALGREIHDRIDLMLEQEPGDQGLVADVALDKNVPAVPGDLR